MPGSDARWRYAHSGQKHPDDVVCATCGQPLGWIESDRDHLRHFRPDRNNCPVRIPWADATTRKNYRPGAGDADRRRIAAAIAEMFPPVDTA